VPSGERQVPRSKDLQQRIVGGNTTTIAEWPWQAAITLNPALFTGNGFDRQLCGGSLVAPTIILTAAHCVDDGGFLSPINFASITGRTTLSNDGQGQEIPWSTYHIFVDSSGTPLFDPNTLDWDVVLAELSEPSPSSDSTPIRIAGADEAAFWAPGNENAWATGWGRISSGGARSDTLREVSIDRIADATCGAATSYGGDFHPETMVCAGEIAGGQDTCQGDSGGPLVTPISGGASRLIGDTSWGFACAAPGLPGVYGRVAQDPMCSALQEGVQSVADVNAVGAGGCLGPPPPPPNDDFDDAQNFGDVSSMSTQGTNVDATKEPGEPSHAFNEGGASVWYSWRAPGSGVTVIDLCSSDFDTLLGVYTGSSVGSLTNVVSSDDACGLQSQVSFEATAGVTYRIAVDGWSVGSGPAEGIIGLSLSAPSPPGAASSPGAPGGGAPQAAAPPTCKGKPATIVGTVGRDAVKGTSRRNVIVGLGGNDKLSGLGGNDLICGGKGNDTLNGGKGKDKLYGQKGKDTLKGGAGKDTLKGGAGKDKQVQ
jgi:Ca2+-binding RTX toxin-like protein